MRTPNAAPASRSRPRSSRRTTGEPAALAGETFEDAARRVLVAETGILAPTVGPFLLERDDVGQRPDYGEQDIRSRGRHFLVRLTANEAARPDPAALARSGYGAYRWWTLGELDAAIEAIWPQELADIVRRVGGHR